MTKLLVALIASALSVKAALAQDIDCSNAQIQLEMTFCAERDWQIADADLNDAYKAAQGLMAKVDADLPAMERGAVASLRDAQRAWVTFRDAACAAEGYSSHGGSIEPMIIYFCRARLTEARAADLWALGQQ